MSVDQPNRLPQPLRRQTAAAGMATPPAPKCYCGRPVPESSGCGCCCAEHDVDVAAVANALMAISARFDERYDPSPEPIDRRIQ